MDTSNLVIFRVGNEEYGLPIEKVISIDKLDNINVIPTMPLYMKGVTTVRGELIPVLDMNQIFFEQNTRIDENTKLIVVQAEGFSAALAVIESMEIKHIKKSHLKSIPVALFQETKYFIAAASKDERLILIIDPNILIPSLEGISRIKEEIINYD